MKRSSYVERLNRQLESIGRYDLKPDYQMYPEREQVRASGGPSNWDFVKNYQRYFGDCFDYRILDGNVLFPCSIAMQEWIYAKFPEDSTYYTLAPDDGVCWIGVVVDRGLDEIMARAAEDGLLSEEQYVAKMNENDNLMRQGE